MLDTEMLKKLIEDSGVNFRQNSVSWIFQCPKCNKKDKLYLRKRDGRFVCWHCATTENFKGKPEYALRELLNIPISKLREKLYGVNYNTGKVDLVIEIHDFFGDDDIIPEDTIERQEVIFPFDVFPIGDPAAKKGLKYLTEKRGVSLELAQKFDLHYYPEKERVIFPIKVDGVLIGWQGRDVTGNSSLKIVTEGGFQRDYTLMFQDNLKEPGDELSLFEGPITGMKAHLCPGVVVSMGKVVSDGQLRLMIASGKKRWNLGLDLDAAAELRRISRIATSEGIECYRMLPDPGKSGKGDFGDMTDVDTFAAYKKARRIVAGLTFVPPLLDKFSRYGAAPEEL